METAHYVISTDTAEDGSGSLWVLYCIGVFVGSLTMFASVQCYIDRRRQNRGPEDVELQVVAPKSLSESEMFMETELIAHLPYTRFRAVIMSPLGRDLPKLTSNNRTARNKNCHNSHQRRIVSEKKFSS